MEQKKTAAKLNVSYTNLYRELRLNDMTEYNYDAALAQNNYTERKKAAKIARRKKWEKEHVTENQ